ncbi:MAG: UDP-glucose dehydrogenase family protein [Candidatus Nanopelagicales bacterium]|jgi:UDPglucose 6-dehydrogenase
MSVVGTGYLGATHAACMAELGHEVVGIDSDAAKVAALASGTVPFWEPGLDEVLQRGLESGRLTFTTDPADAAGAHVHFVCVGTPQKADSPAADLTQVHGAIDALTPVLGPGALVVGKSTVPVGTAAGIADRVAETGARVAWNPEFLREGHAVEDTLRPDRLVFGVRDPQDEAVLREVYAALLDAGTPLLVTDFATAELVKVAANAFLATKISFINAMAEVCEATGGDILTLSAALGMDPRIGPQFLRAGLGFGGGCLPKDIRAFMARAGELGVDEALMFLRDIDDINIRRRQHTVDLALEALGGQAVGKRVGVWGAAFKPDSDDVRDSPALHVAAALRAAGATVTVHDPRAVDNARRLFSDLEYADTPAGAASGADVVLLLTEWRDYRDLDPALISDVVSARHIIDARNALDPVIWREAGWTYRALGRPIA